MSRLLHFALYYLAIIIQLSHAFVPNFAHSPPILVLSYVDGVKKGLRRDLMYRRLKKHVSEPTKSRDEEELIPIINSLEDDDNNFEIEDDKSGTGKAYSHNQEWQELEDAANADPDAFESMLAQKLNDWKSLKEAGVLTKLGSSFTEEDIDDLDQMSSDLLGRKLNTKKKDRLSKQQKAAEIHGLSPEKIMQDFEALKKGHRDSKYMSEQERIAIYEEYGKKLTSISNKGQGSSSRSVINLFNEIRDKSLYRNQHELIQNILLKLTRTMSTPNANEDDGKKDKKESDVIVNIFRQYMDWLYNDESSNGNAVFKPEAKEQVAYYINTLINSCFSNGLYDAGKIILKDCMQTYSQQLTIQDAPLYFLPTMISGEILENVPILERTSDYNTLHIPTSIQERLHELYTNLPFLTTAQVNVVIRAMGKRRMIRQVFNLLKEMKRVSRTNKLKRILPNDESFEFLANALVASVEEEKRARNMKDLPTTKSDMPEVLLVGRSNVGKSTLVNFLVNRKALASVSATPGHTTQFHFYGVNINRKDLPSFRFVDVPGLGYAEAEENTLVSWKSLLERYITIRDSLQVVLHLVDSRHELTDTDRLLFAMAATASKERRDSGKSPFQYAVILTKTDRTAEHVLEKNTQAVMESTESLSAQMRGPESMIDGSSSSNGDDGDYSANGVRVIATSNVNRIGRDAVWEMLQKVLT